MNVRDAIEQRFRSKSMRMREALERFNDEAAEREKVGDNWNVRDLAGHFIFWINEAADRIPGTVLGQVVTNGRFDAGTALSEPRAYRPHSCRRYGTHHPLWFFSCS